MKKSLIVFLLIIVAIIGTYVLSKTSSQETPVVPGQAITVFKSPTCGCCAVYTRYLDNKGYDVTINEIPDTSTEQKKYGVPNQMRSCHTSIVGNYFVEGHVPIEAIEKLLAEKPSIKGIAMPGMPAGSPGMPGSKSGPFIIYAINNDGSVQEFMRL